MFLSFFPYYSPTSHLHTQRQTQVLPEVIAENQFPLIVHFYMNFQHVGCSWCWSMCFSVSLLFRVWALHQCTFLSCGGSLDRFLEILPYDPLSVNIVAANQIDYTATFYWRTRTGALTVINLDSKARKASFLNAFWHGWLKSCYIHAVYWLMHLLFLYVIRAPVGSNFHFLMHCF